MILLVTNARDITCDFLVLELQRRGCAHFRLNSECLPAMRVNFSGQTVEWSLETKKRLLNGRDVRAAYFRRPGSPIVNPQVRERGEKAYCAAEWAALLKTLYGRLDGRWLSSPWDIARAEDKPLQLQRAFALGFNVPETVITNDYAVARLTADRDPTIVKPLRTALVEGESERVIFTSRWEDPSEADSMSWEAAPIIVQHEVRKSADVRVTVVNEKVFAVAINSQIDTRSEVDWRQAGNAAALPHEPIVLPDYIADRCRALVKSFGLRFGAIDLILDRAGKFWFLEINPNGQWAWIEKRTGLPIASAIVDALEAVS